MTSFFDDFTIRVNTDVEIDPTHVEITISTSGPDPTDDHTMAEAAEAARRAAGILGRLAVTLSDDLALTRRKHNCLHIPEHGLPQCQINGPVEEFTNPTINLGDGSPTLWISIPVECEKTWVRLVKKQLAAILKADQWQPTQSDEHNWASIPHQSALPPIHILPPQHDDRLEVQTTR